MPGAQSSRPRVSGLTPVSCSVQVDAPTAPPQSAGTSAGEAVAEQVCDSAIEPGPPDPAAREEFGLNRADPHVALATGGLGTGGGARGGSW